jgi:hypothetical protein
MLIADSNTAPVGGDVSGLQVAVDLLLVDSERRQSLPRDFQLDNFFLRGKKFHCFDTLDQQQFTSQKLGIAA